MSPIMIKNRSGPYIHWGLFLSEPFQSLLSFHLSLRFFCIGTFTCVFIDSCKDMDKLREREREFILVVVKEVV